MKRFTLVILLYCILFLSGQALAVPILDQESPVTNAAFNGLYNWQQEVKAGRTGLLTGIDFFVADAETGSIDIGVAAGTAWQTDLDFQTHVSVHSGLNFVDVSSAGIMLTANDMFVIDFNNGNHLDLRGSAAPGQYSQGRLFLNGSPYNVQNYWDIAFRTYVDPDVTPVPEPATMLLLGTGIAGLVVTRLRRKKT